MGAVKVLGRGRFRSAKLMTPISCSTRNRLPGDLTRAPHPEASSKSTQYVLLVRVGREVFLKSRKLIDQRRKWSPREFCNFIFHMQN